MRNHFLTLVLLILTTSGCQSTPDRASSPDGFNERDPQTLIDEALTRSGEAAAALIIDASKLYLFRGDPEAALATLDLLVKLDLDAKFEASLGDSLARQRARALEGIGQYAAAREELASLQQMTVADFLQTALVCAQINAHGCAADGYIQAAQKSEFDPAALPDDINDLIWEHLSRARRGPSVFTHQIHHAWWLLQQQLRAADSASSQVNAWRTWKVDNPDHPAHLNPPQALALLEDYRLPNIGVLLPLSGPLASAGQALQNGLVSAYLAERNTQKPNVAFYDCAANDLSAVFETALNDGIDVLVGPLVKENVERFAMIAEAAQVPTLLLNYLADDSTSYRYVFQLGIAIEDETNTLAAVVLAEGHERVLIIHSDEGWSRRAMNEFADLWRYAYAAADFSDIKGLTDAVGESMQVAASRARSARLGRILGESLEFSPRARKDFDAVIALTTQLESRALIPALQFHFAADLPVYATSQSARGEHLAELQGFRLTELPIFAYPTGKQKQLLQAYDLVSNPLAELYALGFDAYKIATWLPLLESRKSLTQPGATGYLDLQQNGRFQRSLSVNTVLDEGRLTPLEF